MKKKLFVFLWLLTGCSSPPQAPQIDWDDKREVMNTQLMAWTPTNDVIKSEETTGHWAKKIVQFIPENRLYDDAVFYAVAHSTRIMVETSGATEFFKATDWLRKNGAKGVIEFHSNKLCASCGTTLYLER